MKILLLLIGVIHCSDFGDETYETIQPFEPIPFKSNAPKNPGPPLGEADSFLAKQLGTKPTNETSENMMLPPITSDDLMEELELEGQKHERRELKFGMAKVKYHWPWGVVPYSIDAAFSDDERAIIKQGMDHIEEFSCVRFIPRTSENDYMDIVPPPSGKSGCYAQLPYILGDGRREVGLEQDGCVTNKIVIHELLHILGVNHEQVRPDRDTYITIHWNNLRENSQLNYWRDVWVGETSKPAKCQYPDPPVDGNGVDYSSCYSGWEVEACGVNGQPYDYESVMHYRLNAFAINSNQNTMTPTDSSITAAGNSEMSALDKTKLQCMYYCDGTTYSGCGGHQTGDSGSLDALNDDKCQWRIVVEEGSQIELTVTQFDVDCADKLEIYTGETYIGNFNYEYTGKTEYCNGNEAKIITTPSNMLYIKWGRTISTNKFYATWKKVSGVECCAAIKVESSGSAATKLSSYMGTYTYTEGDDINNYYIYRKTDGNGKWFAVKTVSEGYYASWIGGSSSPGSSSGSIFGPHPEAKCVHSETTWQYWDGVSITDNDPTLKVVCDVSCSANPPTGGDSNDWDGQSKSFGTIVTYQCSDGQRMYSQCKADGTWSPSTISACGSAPTPPPPTPPTPPPPTPPTPPPPTPPTPPPPTPPTPPPPTPPTPPPPTPPTPPPPTPPTPPPPTPPTPTPPTPPPTTKPTPPPPTTPKPCKPKFMKNKMVVGGKKIKGRKLKTKNVQLCWKKCQVTKNCKFVTWIKKSKNKKLKKTCMLYSSKKKFKKRSGYVTGKC